MFCGACPVYVFVGEVAVPGEPAGGMPGSRGVPELLKKG